MEDSNNILKKGLEKPSVDFTKNLMKHIEAEENLLSRVVKEHAEMTTSPSFSSDLMSQLEGITPKKPYEPVISNRTWGGIAAVLVVIVTLVFTTSGSEASGIPVYFSKIDFNIVNKIESNPILIYSICGVLLLSIALLTEQRLTNKKGA